MRTPDELPADLDFAKIARDISEEILADDDKFLPSTRGPIAAAVYTHLADVAENLGTEEADRLAQDWLSEQEECVAAKVFGCASAEGGRAVKIDIGNGFMPFCPWAGKVAGKKLWCRPLANRLVEKLVGLGYQVSVAPLDAESASLYPPDEDHELGEEVNWPVRLTVSW